MSYEVKHHACTVPFHYNKRGWGLNGWEKDIKSGTQDAAIFFNGWIGKVKKLAYIDNRKHSLLFFI